MDNEWARDEDTGLQRLQGISKEKGRDCRALKEVGEGSVLKTNWFWRGSVGERSEKESAQSTTYLEDLFGPAKKKEKRTVSSLAPPLHAKLGLELTIWTLHQTLDPSKSSRR